MKYRISENSIKLINSCLVHKVDFEKELNKIKNLHPNLPLWNRSVSSLRREWATHNILYDLGLFMERTTDVDLNFKHKWYVSLAYWIVGEIALLFIK